MRTSGAGPENAFKFQIYSGSLTHSLTRSLFLPSVMERVSGKRKREEEGRVEAVLRCFYEAEDVGRALDQLEALLTQWMSSAVSEGVSEGVSGVEVLLRPELLARLSVR